MKTILTTLALTVLTIAGVYVLRDGSAHAGEHSRELVQLISGNHRPPSPAPAPVATPAPQLAVQPPPATPAPGPTPVPTPIATPAPIPVAAATPDPNEPRLVLASLSSSRDEWPRQVMLKKAFTFPAMVNGAVVGSIEVPKATLVSLNVVQGEKVAVAFQGASQVVGAFDTDLIERVRENRRQGIIPNKPKLVLASLAPATAPELKKSTFFEDLNKAAKIKPKVNLPPEIAALVKDAEALAPNPKNKFEAGEEAREEWKDKAKRYMELPVDQVTAHPSAAEFPGAVPADAPRLKREFTFPLNMPRWQSTGLYAAPGEKVTVHVTSQDAKIGLSVIVGAHRDQIFKRDKWPRFPIISRTFKITEPRTEVANAFGGLIYIDIPRDPEMGGYNVPTYGGYGWLDEDPKKVRGSVKVTIEGGVEAAYFRLGKTPPEEWQKMRHAPAPWGELASDTMILTLPMDLIRGIEDPSAIMKFWDEVVDAEDDLVGWPRRTAPPTRMVPDLEISNGLLHSGYPIMGEFSTAAGMVDLRKLKERGGWGYFHEIGHNHEAQAATFGGDYVEVNVNFCSLYVMEMVVKKEMTRGHPALDDIDKLLHARLGPEKKKDAFENLGMYILPIQALGWETFQQTIASYSAPDGAKGISTREDKMDQWVLRYSQNTGKNLVPYFEAFEITCSTQTKEKLKKLPVWLPKPSFPKNYER